MTRKASGRSASVRVLHLTDPHLFASTKGELRGRNTHRSLTDVLNHFRTSKWSADIVTCTGDLIQDDSPQAYDEFKKLLRPLGLPIHCVPGNHDIRDIMQTSLDERPFYYCDTADFGDWSMIGIDSCVADSAGGEVSASEFRRLAAAITASKAKHILVCLHHPPVPVGSKWLDTVGLRNGDKFMEQLKSAGRVRLAIFGHVHQEYDRQHDNVRIIGTPSTCRQFLRGSDDFAVDDRSPAYRRLTLHANGDIDSKLVWIGDA